MADTRTTGGDLGRRAAHRRAELGLTADQVAARARMTPGYVDYLEDHAAVISTSALARLAGALETTSAALLGEHPDRPLGSAVPGRLPLLEELGEEECRRLIAPGGVGRVVFQTEHGPAAFPVNYAVVDGAIVFRTAVGGGLAGLDGIDVGFQIDRVDEVVSEGWSVLVAGKAGRIADPREIWRLHEIVKPWVGADRRACMRIDDRRITGRRIYAN